MEPVIDRATGLPIGPEVDTTPALRPQRVRLEGAHVELVPLEPAHADQLYEDAHGPDKDRLWLYLYEAPFPDRASFQRHIEDKARSQDPLFFALIDKKTGNAQGYATLMRIEPLHRVIEVGNILFTPAMQRSIAATETMYLLARYVFDTLRYRRYEWKCNDLNAPSKRAAQRLGFSFEGIFRQHVIVKGRNRDTAWYAMLDSEWPQRKRAFELWLSPENFDADGRQKTSLSVLNGAGSS